MPFLYYYQIWKMPLTKESWDKTALFKYSLSPLAPSYILFCFRLLPKQKLFYFDMAIILGCWSIKPFVIRWSLYYHNSLNPPEKKKQMLIGLPKLSWSFFVNWLRDAFFFYSQSFVVRVFPKKNIELVLHRISVEFF